MKTEKKLIIFCVLALMVGVASIAPLIFLMGGKVKAETVPIDPQFKITPLFGYVVQTNVTVPTQQNDTTPTKVIQSVNCVVNFNFTLLDDPATVKADARVEYYRIDLSSDQGYLGTMQMFTGATYKQGYVYHPYNFSSTGWFGEKTTNGGGKLVGTAVQGGTYTNGESTGGNVWVKDFGDPQILFITVSRVGDVTYRGDSASLTRAEGEVLSVMQLERYGDGFLCNNALNETELNQIIQFAQSYPTPRP